MARTSNITFAQVAQIADTMKAAGHRPTARAVRERIGSGSMGTVHKLLQQWAGRANVESNDAPELPSSITSILMDFVQTQIAEACEPLTEELRAAKESADALAEENERLAAKINELEKEVTEGIAGRADAMARADSFRSVSDRQQETIREQQKQLQALTLEVDRANRRAEKHEEAATELQTARETVIQATGEQNNAERKAAVLEAQLTAALDKISDLSERLEASQREATTAKNIADKERTNYQTCAAHLEAAAREIESLNKLTKTPKASAPKKATTTKRSTENETI